jgi:TfoX/Sxy family transcriptional regulator of competence genes
MASSAEYLEYVLDLLTGVPEVSYLKMMGEYLLYASGKLFGGVYDDRFLVRDTEASRAMLSVFEAPYKGASDMLLVDVEDRGAVAALVADMLPELPEPKRRRKQVVHGNS